MTSRWIHPAESLPKEGQKVLCYGPKGGWYIGEVFYRLGRPEWYAPGKTKPNPVAWMPLPEEPRREA